MTDETKPFWDGVAAGKLLIKHCNACGSNYHYPRPLCPSCMSADTDWTEVSGNGTLYTFTLLRDGPAPAYVTLAEGPTIMTALVDFDPSSIAIGAAVRVDFRPLQADGPAMPVFIPIG